MSADFPSALTYLLQLFRILNGLQVPLDLPFHTTAHTHLEFFVQKKTSEENLGSLEFTVLLNYQSRLLDDSSNTTVNITTCIVLNIFSIVLFYKIVQFVIIISISKVFQVQNKPMGFLPPSYSCKRMAHMSHPLLSICHFF